MTRWLAGAAAVVLAPVVLIGAAFGGLAGPDGQLRAADAARLGIPTRMLHAYLAAAAHAPHLPGGCAVPWTVLAGIGEVESGHARGSHVAANGDVRPRIVGPALAGRPGVARIPDSDGGRWDDDTVWDRAVGPMQFLPSSWRRFGQDGNGDGAADPHNADDAALAAAAHLCQAPPAPPEGKDLADPAQLRRALLAYNRSQRYADQVLTAIDRYQTAAAGTVAVGGYALPVDRPWLSPARLAATHHDYPAWDLPLPEGTPIHAVHGGRVAAVTARASRCGLGVLIAGHDGHSYVYCHASAVLVGVGADVVAGQALMRSGNTGRSTGPHLHLGIRRPDGASVCPQPLLAAWYHGVPAHPSTAPTSGCTH